MKVSNPAARVMECMGGRSSERINRGRGWSSVGGMRGGWKGRSRRRAALSGGL